MDKEEALTGFLKGLRVVLSNALAYPKDHPYFKDSVESFKHKLEAVFDYMDPVTLGVSSDSLFLDNRFWDKGTVYSELAKLLHYRKIKSIEIRRGVSTEELAGLLAAVAMPVRDILKAGGVNNIMSADSPSPHILIHELDYSDLLKSAGGAKKDLDLWGYLLNDALRKNDQKAIEEAFGDFIGMSEGVDLDQLLADKELLSSINGLIVYIKNHRRDKAVAFSKAVLGIALNSKSSINDEKLDVLKELFRNLGCGDLAKLLWDKALFDNEFDAFGLDIFTRLAGMERQGELNAELGKNIPGGDIDADSERRISELLRSSRNNNVSEVYRNTLSLLSKSISFVKGAVSFGHEELRVNYRLALLNMLVFEIDQERLAMVLRQIDKELENAIKANDIKFCKYLSDTLASKASEDPEFIKLSAALGDSISKFVETELWEDVESAELDSLILGLRKTSFGADFYLKKIFGENKVNSHVLRMFFKFFPQDVDSFYSNLEGKVYDFEFISAVIHALKDVDSSISAQMLKYIYLAESEFMQIKAVEAMGGQTQIDEGLLLSALKRNNFSMRRAAAAVLKRDAAMRAKAAGSLFDVRAFLWAGNRLIMENMEIAGQLDIREAAGYLDKLSRRRFFWNARLRSKAREILRAWNVEKH